MASEQDFELLAQVGPGTAMGRLMREYWIPACGSAELVAGRAAAAAHAAGREAHRLPRQRGPRRHHGSPLPASRRLAVLRRATRNAACAASITAGNSTSTGQCLDMPNVPPEHSSRQRSRRKRLSGGRAQRHRLGLYGRARRRRRRCRRLEPLLLPEQEIAHHLGAARVQLAAGAGRRHRHLAFRLPPRGQGQARGLPAGRDAPPPAHQPRAGLSMSPIPSGARCTPAYRPADPGNPYYRFAHFLFPFWTMIPNGEFQRQRRRARLGPDGRHAHDVPVSVLEVRIHADRGARRSDVPPAPGAGVFDYLPNTTDWYGRWRLAQNAANDYGIDREAQRDAQLHRHRGRPSPGPGGDREHGPDRRSRLRASDDQRSHDRRARAGASCARRRRSPKPASTPPGVDRSRNLPRRAWRRLRGARAPVVARGLQRPAQCLGQPDRGATPPRPRRRIARCEEEAPPGYPVVVFPPHGKSVL